MPHHLPLIIAAEGTVCESRPGTDRASNAFPSICALPTGRWICGFRAAPNKTGTIGQRAMVTLSDDQGRSWSEPTAPFDPPAVHGHPGLFRQVGFISVGGDVVAAVLCWVDHSDPSLPFFNEKTEGLLDCRIFIAGSEDGGLTWSRPWPVDTSPFDVPTPTTGPLLLLANGELACQFELNKHYNDTAVWRHSSVLKFSSDGGRTWPEHVIAANDPVNRVFYWDQRPGVLSDGSILNVFWTYDNPAASYLNIHARRSTDNGRTWSALWDTGVPGQPAPPVSLADGRVVMVYVDRTAQPIIKARVSADGGRTWPAESEVVIYDHQRGLATRAKREMKDAWSEMGAFSVGLPATARTPDGDVVVVYYAGPATDETGIRWARLSAAKA